MSDADRVRLRTVDGGPTAVGSAGPHTLIADRPAAAGLDEVDRIAEIPSSARGTTPVQLRGRTIRGADGPGRS